MCVKCGGTPNSKECKKSKETPAKCALCEDNHPANCKGCEHYHNLIKRNNTFRNNTQRTPPVNTNIHTYIHIYIYINHINIVLTHNNKEVTQM